MKTGVQKKKVESLTDRMDQIGRNVDNTLANALDRIRQAELRMDQIDGVNKQAFMRIAAIETKAREIEHDLDRRVDAGSQRIDNLEEGQQATSAALMQAHATMQEIKTAICEVKNLTNGKMPDAIKTIECRNLADKSKWLLAACKEAHRALCYGDKSINEIRIGLANAIGDVEP